MCWCLSKWVWLSATFGKTPVKHNVSETGISNKSFDLEVKWQKNKNLVIMYSYVIPAEQKLKF